MVCSQLVYFRGRSRRLKKQIKQRSEPGMTQLIRVRNEAARGKSGTRAGQVRNPRGASREPARAEPGTPRAATEEAHCDRQHDQND